MKETYLEQRKQIHGRFGINPFEKQRERRQKIETFCELKGLFEAQVQTSTAYKFNQFLGIDPFPTHNTILSLSEYIPKQTVQQQPFGSPGLIYVNSFSSNLWTNKNNHMFKLQHNLLAALPYLVQKQELHFHSASPPVMFPHFLVRNHRLLLHLGKLWSLHQPPNLRAHFPVLFRLQLVELFLKYY